jgi:1,4-dihydroxy-6-naphthoate synthase
MLSLAISPCPNDTFVFCGMAGRYRLTLDDVEALNRRAESGEFDLTKISVAAYGRVRERYALLRAGGAAGFGVGPVIVATSPREPGGRVAIPGERTTAALLLRLLGDFETVPMRFDRIEDAVLAGEVDCGVLIHEGRFTYERRGLLLLADLGAVWEERMGCPLPLGAVAIRRELGPDAARRLDEEIRESLRHARSRPEDCAGFVRKHAQEMDPDVIRRHIALYVNDYTFALDAPAVERLVSLGEAQGLYEPSAQPLFAYPQEA